MVDPAVASDADDFAKPRRFVTISLGLAIGLVLSIFAVALAELSASVRREWSRNPGSSS